MKSERRHELEHNELADWTVHALEAIKPYTNLIVGAVLATVILAVGISLWTNQAKAKDAIAWNLYYSSIQVGDLELLNDTIKLYPSSRAASWAAVSQGDLLSYKGSYEIFTNKANARQDLDDAITCYLAVQDTSNKTLHARATFGLARAYETKGEIEKAKETYEVLAEKQKNGPFAKLAEKRLADLQKENTLEFYDRFAKYDPKPDLSPETKPTNPPSFEKTGLPAMDEPVKEEKPAEGKLTEEPKKEPELEQEKN